MRTIRKLKIVSNNKVRANRENAKKSTGPRTVSGKEKVSGNALSHGLTAEKHVIIGAVSYTHLTLPTKRIV